MTQTLVVSIQLRIRSKKYAAKICRIKSIHGFFMLGVEMVYKELRRKFPAVTLCGALFNSSFFLQRAVRREMRPRQQFHTS